MLEDMNNTYERNQDWTYTLTENGIEIASGPLAVGRHQVLSGSRSIGATNGTTNTYVLTITYANLTDVNQSEDMGSSLSFKVNIKEEQNTWDNPGTGTLLSAIKTNSPVSTPLTVPGQAVSTAEEAVLASTEDDYGTSYYFRGAVTNNYVNYSGMCWRIVRVQGDGTIKLVLADENGECDADTYSTGNTTSALINSATKYAYSEDISETGAIYASSYIPAELTTWMASKITDTSDLVETDWCNDMSSSVFGFGMNDNYETVYTEEEATQGWYTVLNYGAYGRLNDETTASPSLKCNAKGLNDSKALRYESNIGLLTADEVAFAGETFSSVSNRTYYLSTNVNSVYWTMSPSYYFAVDEYLGVFQLSSAGFLTDGIVDLVKAVRPAVVLQSNVTIAEGGLGTQTNPYVIG